MSKWSDSDEWQSLISGDACPICRDGKPHSIIAELENSYVTAGEDAVLKGACAVFYKRHVVELYELPPDEAAKYMSEIQRVSKAVHRITRAIKMNYEIHGNTIPHLHMHLFPRYIGDPFENAPIDPRRTVGPVYSPGEFQEFAEKVREELSSTENSS